MFKALAAGAAGAAAYNWLHTADLSAVAGGDGLAAGLFEAFERRGAAQMSEVARMHRQVDELQAALLRSLHERAGAAQPPTVIVQGPGGRSSSAPLLGVLVVTGGAVLYLRFVRGWRLADMMLCTKGALTAVQHSVNQGLTSVRAQVEAATADLLSRLGAVGNKQDEMLDRQAGMDAALRGVGEQVCNVAAGVAALHHQVAYSNAAVTALCGALSEVAKRVGLDNGRYTQALEGLAHHRHHQGGSVPAPVQLLPAIEGFAPLDDRSAARVGGGADKAGPGSSSWAPEHPNPAVFLLPRGAVGTASMPARGVGGGPGGFSFAGISSSGGGSSASGRSSGVGGGIGGGSSSGGEAAEPKQRRGWGRSVSELIYGGFPRPAVG